MPKRKASFYGVRVGNQPGVYDDWEVCKGQVLGFPGSQYKGFSTRVEAENYVKDFLTGSQNTETTKTVLIQSQGTANLDVKSKECLLPIARSKKHTMQPCSQKATIPTKRVTSPFQTKKEVPSASQPSTKDLSKCVKVVEENGQNFVVFESIKDFDSYFEALCRSRHSRESWTLKTSFGNQEFRSQDQTSDCSRHSQAKVTVEDEEFVYFKNEDELRTFLEPYFEDAKQELSDPAQIYHNFDAVPRASSFTRQDPLSSAQIPPNFDALLGTSSYVHQVTKDEEFVHLKNEIGLKRFLEPILKEGSEHGPLDSAGVHQNSGAAQATVPSAHQGIYQIEFDGASKGNPGRAGAGALIRCPHGSVVFEMTEFLGKETNNVAEYRALILGLKVALSKGIRRVRAQGDSKLVCLQVTGAWKVENEKLISLHKEVKGLENLFDLFSIAHIRREYNSAADALANEAVFLGEPAREVIKPQPECCL